MTKKIKGVAIGAGYFSHFHYDAWQRIPNAEIIAIADKDLDKAQAVAKQYDIPKVYQDVNTMLEKEQPDFVDIITPPETHLELVEIVAQRGVNIICQKPLAPNLAEAKKIISTAEQANVRLLVHENWRFQPWYRVIKKLLEEEAIGKEIFSLYWRMRMGDGWQKDAYLARQPYFRKMPRLLMYETGVHFIDSFRFLLGEVNGVSARLRRLNPDIAGEDAAWVQFEFENGALATLDANRYNESNYENPRLTFGNVLLEGSGGRIRMGDDGRIYLKKLGEAEVVIPYTISKKGFAGDCVFALQSHLVSSLLENRIAETEGHLYFQNLIIQEAIYKSAEMKSSISVSDFL